MKGATRREILSVSSAGVAAALGGTMFSGFFGDRWRPNTSESSSITEGGTVHLEPFIRGFKQPLALENPIQNHYYIADKFGQIYLHLEGELKEEPILDISEDLIMEHGEQGLLGLEFDPNFATNRRFYVRYSSPPDNDTPEGYSHRFVLSEFLTTEDFREVVPDSERIILEIPEPGRMHNAGAIEFGPDGLLYVAVGDGGGDGHDGSGPFNRGPNSHAEDWYWPNVGGNGQDVTENLLGSVLRIDVNGRDREKTYDVPKNNPLSNKQGLGEHYAWGFRNPYSMTFDGDDLYVTDAATKIAEEVNLVQKGGNYGWNIKEGTGCHNNFPRLRAFSAIGTDIRRLPFCPNTTPSGEELEDPIISQPYLPGGVIVGGEFYRHSKITSIDGKYIFGNLRGRLFAASPSSSKELWNIEELFVSSKKKADITKKLSDNLLSVEMGNDGELFALTAGATGSVQRITRV